MSISCCRFHPLCRQVGPEALGQASWAAASALYFNGTFYQQAGTKKQAFKNKLMYLSDLTACP